METKYSLKQKLGCLVFDVPSIFSALIFKNRWIHTKNRFNKLKTNHKGVDTTNIGIWSEDIHACHVFPITGKYLLKRALEQWQVTFNPNLRSKSSPDVSFVIPFRGTNHLPLLKATISTILSQKDVNIECIIIEQSNDQLLINIPNGIRYIHLPNDNNQTYWHKSKAFNVGVSAAKSEIVVCHDADILVPNRFAAEIVSFFQNTLYDVLYLQRFLFCIDKDGTKSLIVHYEIPFNRAPERVRQNWQGGTVAIRKKAFFSIGGFDERFVGWGGEDNEFFDRCKLLNAYRFGYLPFIHLWHPPQNTKTHSLENPNITLLNNLLEIPPQKRVNFLLETQSLSQ